MTESALLGHYVQLFFGDYLTTQRNLSPHTIASYRDAIKLLLIYAASKKGRPVADLAFDDFGPDVVLGFLEDLEKRRHNSIRTRNSRLAAIHSLFRYVGAHEPTLLGLCQRVSAIPTKRAPSTNVNYLEQDEVDAILAAVDQSTALGRRDHLLITLLFETGVRAQEVAGLRTRSLRLEGCPQVTVLGKGRKERVCPLRESTAARIRAHIRERDVGARDEPLFVGTHGAELTRIGVLRAVQRHVRRASRGSPRLAAKRIGAHTFRHSAAVHMLRAGNDLSVIKSLLGHVSIMTTDQYTDIDMKTKRQALEASAPIKARRRRASWQRKPDLLKWLESL
ncbi:MAG: tyrosine-type recombinase/integrase [Acidobacteriota bacterium]